MTFQRWSGWASAAAGIFVAGSLAAAAASAGVVSDTTAVERGRYLATAGNCVSCHTRPNGAAYAGGVAFETPMGVIHSTNITPDPTTGIGRWRLEDFRRAMHEGVAPDGRHLFPAFPFTSFTKISDADIADLFQYMRTLKAERAPEFRNGPLFAMRWPMAVWKGMQFQPERFQTRPDRKIDWNRGAYLVEGLLHCGACHSPRNWMLAERADAPLQGGSLRADAGNGSIRDWSAVDLSSGDRGLSSWSEQDLARYLQRGICSKAGSFGPMNEVIVNSTRFLKEEDLRAVAVYIKSIRKTASAPATSENPGNGDNGAAVYKERCAKCHGPAGRGSLFSGPPLAGSAIVQADDAASLINIILFGPKTASEVSYGQWETMRSYADRLDDQQVADVSNYLRRSWGNRAPAVRASQVQRQR